MFGESEQGGFMPSQNNDMSGGAMKDTRKPRTDQTVMPLTVKQLLGADRGEGDVLTINGKELSHVMLVGAVTAVNPSQLTLKYQVDDGTGKVDVTWWMDDDGDMATSKRASAIREGIYVRVVGKTRMHQDQMQLTAFDVSPLADHNQITYHFLSCIKAHLAHTQPAPAASAQAAGAGFAYGARPEPAAAAPTTGGASMDMDMGGEAGLNPQQNKVLSVIAENSMSEEGASIQQLQSQLAGMSEADIRTVIDFLSSEGHLYSTIDEDHFKATSVDTF
jgi:replication factor A2